MFIKITVNVYYDFSEYPEDHFLCGTENQAVVGKFKKEMEGKIITEFVGLISKVYSITIQDDVKQKKVAKRVKNVLLTKNWNLMIMIMF